MKYCKECGLLMDSSALSGTDAEGHLLPDYCCYCVDKGHWTPGRARLKGTKDDTRE